jgi:integrase
LSEQPKISDWRLHDLRRTAATGMAGLKIAPYVVDKVLNHSGGTIRGVAAIYNRFEYLDERRTALDAWGQHVSNLVSPSPNNIVKLRA